MQHCLCEAGLHNSFTSGCVGGNGLYPLPHGVISLNYKIFIFTFTWNYSNKGNYK